MTIIINLSRWTVLRLNCLRHARATGHRFFPNASTRGTGHQLVGRCSTSMITFLPARRRSVSSFVLMCPTTTTRERRSQLLSHRRKDEETTLRRRPHTRPAVLSTGRRFITSCAAAPPRSPGEFPGAKQSLILSPFVQFVFTNKRNLPSLVSPRAGGYRTVRASHLASSIRLISAPARRAYLFIPAVVDSK